MVKKKRSNIGLCVYCGQKAIITRDHVFPRALFNSPFPENNILVNSCKKCNNSYSIDEELFRTIIAGAATFTEEGQKLWHNRVMKSSFERSPKFKNYIKESIITVDVYSKAGIFLGKLPALQIDQLKEKRMKRVIKKMTKGLYYHHYNRIIDDSVKTQITFIKQIDEETLNYLNQLHYNIIGNREIIYWYGKTVEYDYLSFWGILFYNTLLSTVITYTDELKSNIFG